MTWQHEKVKISSFCVILAMLKLKQDVSQLREYL